MPMITILDIEKNPEFWRRMDPDYWDPEILRMIRMLKRKWRAVPLGEYLELITYGQVGHREFSENGEVLYIQTRNLTPTGIDYFKKYARVKAGSYNDPLRSRLAVDDVLLGNAGVAAIGRCVWVDRLPGLVNISQDIDILRLHTINPPEVCVFLKSTFGKRQIERFCKGVGAPKIPFDDVRALLIPMLPFSVSKQITNKMRRIARIHRRAIRRKAHLFSELGFSNEQCEHDRDYLKQTHKAETELVALINDYEAYVHGKRTSISD